MTWDGRGSTLGTRDLDVIAFLWAGQIYSVHTGLLQPQKQLQLVAYRGPSFQSGQHKSSLGLRGPQVMFLLPPQSSASLWHHCEHRETYQKLLEDIAVLHRLAARLSSRAEMVGAVRQVSSALPLVTGAECKR